MNEESSKYVDLIAISKMLDEKLTKVTHSHLNSKFKYESNFINDQLFKNNFDNEYIITNNEIQLLSKVKNYPENEIIYLDFNEVDNSKGNILFVHGLFDDNKFNYEFLFRLLRENKFNIYFMTLPYHYKRKPSKSVFSGEFFYSADMYRTQNALHQSILDLDLVLKFLEKYNDNETMIVSFSMGGCLSLKYKMESKCKNKLFLINPLTDLSDTVWDNPLLVSIKKDLEESNFTRQEYKNIFNDLDPIETIKDDIVNNLAVGYSIFDQIIELSKYKYFLEKFKFAKSYQYNAGHLNVLRVPKLASDIIEFYNK